MVDEDTTTKHSSVGGDALLANWVAPLANVIENLCLPCKKDQKDHQDWLLRCLKRRLDFIDEIFGKDKTQRQSKHQSWPFIWPNEEDLAELADLIFKLASTLRKKKLSITAAATALDQRWPSLKLDRFFLRLGRRMESLSLDLPAESNEVRHFKRIVESAERKLPNALAAEFLSAHNSLLTGKVKPSQIVWSRFRELLCDEGASSIKLKNHTIAVPLDSDIHCYAKYLELHRGQLLFLEASRWSEATRERQPLYQWLEKHDVEHARWLGKLKEKRRVGAKKRKQRERSRKKLRRIA